MYNNLKNKIFSFVPGTNNINDAMAVIKRAGQFPSWQYNGVTEFGIVLDWCEDQFGDDYIWNW
jgi:hypothetical protein